MVYWRLDFLSGGNLFVRFTHVYERRTLSKKSRKVHGAYRTIFIAFDRVDAGTDPDQHAKRKTIDHRTILRKFHKNLHSLYKILA